MALFKRVTLFLVTNLAVMLVLGIALSVLGYFGWLPEGQYAVYLVMAGVFGFGGAFISLAISKWMAKRATGAQVIVTPRNDTEMWLMDVVRRQSQRAGIAMPEVAIYESPDLNAFATGPSRNNSLVAVSTGLIRGMQKNEVEAVLGHEISHVANGDMVTLTLIQGVVNTFVIFFARVIGDVVDRALFRREGEESRPGIGHFVVVMVAQVVLGVLASIIVAWFSRRREFRADQGGARLTGASNMKQALERLRRSEPSHLPESMAAFGITSGRLSALFSTHPPLEARIARLAGSGSSGQSLGSVAAAR